MGWQAFITAGIDFNMDAPPAPERSPVYVRHLAEVDTAFANAIDELQLIRETFARFPEADADLDSIMPRLQQKLHVTDMAIGRFRATRDCRGAG